MTQQKKTSTVSIITATYNRAEFLTHTIESVLGQTYPHFEMHIIDDGSTDNTREIVKSYLSDERIKFYQQKNSGQAVARNLGLGKAKGDYICFLDSDDLFLHDKLEFHVKFLDENPEIGVIYGDNIKIDENGDELHRKNMTRWSGNIYEKLLMSNFISMSTATARRICFDELGGMDEEIKAGDDYELWLRFSTKYKFHYEPRLFSKYRKMTNQISTNKDNRYKYNKLIIEKSIKGNPSLVSGSTKRYIWCRYFNSRGNYHLNNKQYGNAFRDFIMAIKYAPFRWLPWRSFFRGLIISVIR